MGLDIEKMLCAKPRVFHKRESSLCHKHAVTLLTQPGHVDEQLKECLKSPKEENKNCHLKIVQSISYLAKALLVIRASKTSRQISSWYTIRQGCKPPLDQSHPDCCEFRVTRTFTSMSLYDGHKDILRAILNLSTFPV